MKTLASCLVAALLSACGLQPAQNVNLVSMKNGKEVYSASGLIMVPEMYDGVTKPYIERDLSAVCPAGVDFMEHKEAMNKHVIFGQDWVQWQALIACK